MGDIQVVPLGAGQDVGRSCILVTMGGRNILLDCGMHMGYQDDRKFPDFSYICPKEELTNYIDCVIISHFHLDHCGSLPHLSEVLKYGGPIYMTYPTKAIAAVLLEDYRKVQADIKGDTTMFTSTNIKDCIKRVIAVNLHEVIQVNDLISIRAFYAGHVLGAAMFEVRIGSQSVLYTGDYNMTPDRHLGAARVVPGLKPDLLISESTYATTIRDSKRARERDFLKKVHDCVMNGGKVLIPVFALGRAQELCILLESYWERLDLKIPVYFSQGLAGKANKYYRLFINWTNEKIKKTFVHRNMFDFKHISPLPDHATAEMPGAMVLLSTPGMLHGGHSLQIFKKWCSEPRNMIIMPGYCVAGTVGAKVIGGMKQIDMDGRTYDINLGVEYMSFSAHADAKGIMQLIRDCQPRNVMFVHGEAGKMEFLKEKVEKECKLPVFKPANGESVLIEGALPLSIDVSEDLLRKSIRLDPTPAKRACPFRAAISQDKMKNTLEVISCEEAAVKCDYPMHSITMSEIDGLELFHGDLCLLRVKDKPTEVELVWTEDLEMWQARVVDILKEFIQADEYRDGDL